MPKNRQFWIKAKPKHYLFEIYKKSLKSMPRQKDRQTIQVGFGLLRGFVYFCEQIF